MWGERKQKALEWWASDFKRTFPTCPICGSDLGYDVATKFATPHFKCRSCMTVWKLIVEGLGWKTQRRYLLVEPDKDLRASSLVKKGDRWHEGYKEEFWKSLDLGGMKMGAEPAAPPRPPLTDLEEEVLDYIDKHGGEISIPEAGEELGLMDDRLKAIIDKLREKGYIEKPTPSPALTDLEKEVLDYIDRHGGEISVPQASEELGLREARLKATIDKLKEKGYIE